MNRAGDSLDCILCDKDDTRFYREENGYEAVQCKGCGLVYVNPRPDGDEMKRLYDGRKTGIDFRAHIEGRDLKTIQARKCLRLIKRYRESGRLLEIGSAAGYFLFEAKRLGYQVQGVDISRRFVEYSENVLDVPCYEGMLEEAPFEDESFDVIYMRNVLSHLVYPRREFEKMYRLLAPGGILILETGNVAELSPKAAGELELPDHLYLFSETTIGKLLKSSGFELLDTYRYALLYASKPAMWLKEKYERIWKHRHSGATGGKERPIKYNSLPPSRMSKRFIAHCAQILRYDVGRILPKSGRRCTLVMIARRPNEQTGKRECHGKR